MGGYQLSISTRDSDDTFAQARTLTLSSEETASVSGQVDQAGEADYYQFAAPFTGLITHRGRCCAGAARCGVAPAILDCLRQRNRRGLGNRFCRRGDRPARFLRSSKARFTSSEAAQKERIPAATRSTSLRRRHCPEVPARSRSRLLRVGLRPSTEPSDCPTPRRFTASPRPFPA